MRVHPLRVVRCGAKMAQQAGQSPMGSVTARLHGSEWDRERAGDFRVGQLIVVLEPDELPVLGGQFLQRLAHLRYVVDLFG
jgi:hypothetical protein